MKKEITSLGKNTIIYGAGILISRAVSFIMLPIYTSYLTPADYGVLELLSMTLDIIAFIAGCGIVSTVFKYYYEYENIEDKNELISTSNGMIFFITLLTAVMGFLLSENLSMIVFRKTDNTIYFQIIFINYFLQSISIVPLMYVRAIQEAKLFISINVIKLILQVSLNIIFLINLRMGVKGILYSVLLSQLLISSYLFIYMIPKVGLRISFSKGKRMIKFGYPFIFTSLSSFVITYSDRYFLNAYGTLATVGIYSLAYKFGFLHAYLAVGPFIQVWDPQRFGIAKQEDALAIFKKVFLYFNVVVISLALFISLFAKDIITIMSDSAFHDASRIVPIIIVAYVLQAWTYFCDIGLYLKERSNYMAYAYLISAISVIALNFLLIPRYGPYGAAWATVGAFLVRFIILYVFSQKSFRIDYDWGKHMQLIIFTVIIYILSVTIETPQVTMSLVKNSIAMLIFGIISYTLLDKYEKSVVMQLIKNPRSIAKIFQ